MREILLVTKGHPYEREPFYQIFDDMPEVNYNNYSLRSSPMTTRYLFMVPKWLTYLKEL